MACAITYGKKINSFVMSGAQNARNSCDCNFQPNHLQYRVTVVGQKSAHTGQDYSRQISPKAAKLSTTQYKVTGPTFKRVYLDLSSVGRHIRWDVALLVVAVNVYFLFAD